MVCSAVQSNIMKFPFVGAGQRYAGERGEEQKAEGFHIMWIFLKYNKKGDPKAAVNIISEYYSSEIAPIGHAPAQVPQLMHTSGSML